MCDVDSFNIGVKHSILEEWLIFSANTVHNYNCSVFNGIVFMLKSSH